jgi:hypothetical protein
VADDLRTLAFDALRSVVHSGPFLAGPPRSRRLAKTFAARLADAVLAAVLPAHRAQVLDEAAKAISDNVRNDDWSKQDRGGFYGIAPKMAYVAGHDKAVDIVRRLAATGPTDAPGPRQEPEGGPAVPEATREPRSGSQAAETSGPENPDYKLGYYHQLETFDVGWLASEVRMLHERVRTGERDLREARLDCARRVEHAISEAAEYLRDRAKFPQVVSGKYRIEGWLGAADAIERRAAGERQFWEHVVEAKP